MARKKSAVGTKSRSLVYEESYFPNRNDMLQSALDAVYLKKDLSEAEYQAKLEATKDLTRGIDSELKRLRKLRDDLQVKQLDKNAAAQQWTAGQRNSALRLEYTVLAANNRFMAGQLAYDARGGAATGSRNVGVPGLEDSDINEARRTYTNFPADINTGLRAFRDKLATTGELGKSAQQVDLGMAYMADTYVSEKLGELDRGEGDPGDVALYQAMAGDANGQRKLAAGIVVDGITDLAIRGEVVRGAQTMEELTKRRGQGLSEQELGNLVKSGKIPVNPAIPPNYADILGDVSTRIDELQKRRTEVTPTAPKPMTEGDIIEAQRDEYFKSFYPGAQPAYQTNRMLSNILSGTLDPAIMAEIQNLASAEARAGRMPAEGPLGPEVENASGRRMFTGKEGPRMPGDIVEETGTPFSDEARRILSNEGENQFYAEGMSQEDLQRKADELFRIGLIMKADKKKDGKTLYTVVPVGSIGKDYKGDLVVPDRNLYSQSFDKRDPSQFVSYPESEFSFDKSAVQSEQEYGRKLLTLDKMIDELIPLVTDPENKYADIDQIQLRKLAEKRNQLIKEGPPLKPADTTYEQKLEEFQKAQALLQDLKTKEKTLPSPDESPGASKEISDFKAAKAVAEKEVSRITDELKTAVDLQTLDQPFRYPFEDRSPNDGERELTPFFRQPGGAADRRAVDKIPEKPTAEGRDASFKLNSAIRAGELVDNDQLASYLSKPVGSAVEQLYKANKAKGNQTDKELLSYIAKEFPKTEDQEIAATTLLGLSYKDSLSGKLG